MESKEAKILVGKIFGKDTAEDKEIVDFYLRVNQVAMDEYAQQDAIEFSKWCQENKQYYLGNDEWSVLENNKAETYRSKALYNSYLQDKQK